DDNFTSNTSSAQAANVTTILSGKGAQRKTSTVRVTSNSYTQTEDPDYVPGDSADPGVSSPSTEQSGSLGLE
ncbi:MAG: hypothetical protein K9L61_04440, partial [Candidatus Omnitrophica bacterium]|nr:hypothetical protein [Candidatus Omnitrophota bacterium]